MKSIPQHALPARKSQSKGECAKQAVKEAKNIKFPASLLPLLNEWRDLPAKFFEQWVVAENVESGLHSVGAIQSESTVGESQTRRVAMIFREQIL